MPDGNEAIAVSVVSSIDQIPADQWDACAGGVNPFVSHAFLKALEDSGTVVPDKGWLPRHLVVSGPDGNVAACAPAYIKGHSYGEYVFDWSWAQAYESAGGNYYPKLLCAVPFTPVPGPRFLVHPNSDRALMEKALGGAMVQMVEEGDLSSAHINFIDEDLWQHLGQIGLLRRTGHQFHWHNDAYSDFDDFLAALSSRKRKAIRKERRAVQDSGIDIRTVSGAAITQDHWDALYTFYMDTADRKWGEPYLNRQFFSLLGETMGNQVHLFFAYQDGLPVAGALNLQGRDALYGRYWGCTADFKFLHFELCYYRAIDHAIAHGLDRVEAGAQGAHKIQRGYLPHPTYSAHWISDERLRTPVSRFATHERHETEQEIRYLMKQSPFKAVETK